MTVLKNFLAIIFAIFLIYTPNVEAADRPKIMIANVGVSEDFINEDTEYTNHLYGSSHEIPYHIIERLVVSHRFQIFDFESFEESLLWGEFTGNKPLEIKSNTPLGRAREIASYSNVDYLIYGDFNALYGNGCVFEYFLKNEEFQSLKVTIIVHVMEVKTGRIVAAFKGEGISKRSDLEHPQNLGKNKISLINFDIATRKAADDIANKLIKKNFLNHKGGLPK